MTHALITGSTGFIGQNLVQHLIERGDDVTCLVRPTSNLNNLRHLSPRIAYGDVTDQDSLRSAIKGIDVVYHLAGVTKSLSKSDFMAVNEGGVDHIARACAERRGEATLVVVSSLAAAGPSTNTRARVETDTSSPVSLYGRSKLAGEHAALKYASRVPTTIVRPPIVLGEADHDGLAMFEGIAKWGVHAVPGFNDERVSMIDAKDLAAALTSVAENGNRLTGEPNSESTGIYYAAAEDMPTYAELGRMIGRAIGRENVFVAHMPPAAVWAVAGLSDLAGRIRRRPNILNWDKAREAISGSWTCSPDRITRETGFRPALSIAQRLKQTANWYFEQGWLSTRPVRSKLPERTLKPFRNLSQGMSGGFRKRPDFD